MTCRIFLTKTESFIYLFLYIFGLQLPIVRSSSLLLLIWLPLRFLLFKGAFHLTKRFLFDPYVVKLFGLYFICGCFMIFATTIHLKFDFTLLPTLINVVLHLCAGILLVSLFVYRKYTLHEILCLLIGIFLFQSIFQIFAFFSPSLQSFVELFHSNTTTEIAQMYSNNRGLALAGTVFFGLSTVYGLVFLFFFKKVIEQNKFTYIDVLSFIILFIGGFFTGRTFFVGVGVAFMYFICSSFSTIKKIKTVWRICVIVVLGSIIIWNALPYSQQVVIWNLLLYVFEMVFNYTNTGSLTTTSSSHLFNEMYFPISLSTFCFGDGLYAGANGTYYLHTDAGYMRNILYMGVGGLMLLMGTDFFLVFGSPARDSQFTRFGLFVFLYLAIIHFKGEVFGYLIMIHCFLFIYYLSYLSTKKQFSLSYKCLQ